MACRRRVSSALCPHGSSEAPLVSQHALGAGLGRRSPAIVRGQWARPQLMHGVAAGDARPGHAIVWSRADRPARMEVEHAFSPKFENARIVRGPSALPSADHTARVVLSGLPPGQRVFYRVRFQNLADLRAWSEPVEGSFSTALASDARDVNIAWSADTVGQGWGLNQAFGGLRLYETMLKTEPDLFVHCGDTIYADAPLQHEVTLDDGSVWKNLILGAKSKVAETLDDYRGNYQYNLLDDHMRRFNAHVAQAVLWDDHEVRDNWYETRDLTLDSLYDDAERGAAGRTRAPGVSGIQPAADLARRSRAHLSNRRDRAAR